MNTTTFASQNQVLLMTAEDLNNAFKTMLKNFFEENGTLTPKDEDEKLLTTNEVKNLLHVSTTTLYQWKRTGYLTPLKVGLKYLYKQSEIKKLIEQGND